MVEAVRRHGVSHHVVCCHAAIAYVVVPASSKCRLPPRESARVSTGASATVSRRMVSALISFAVALVGRPDAQPGITTTQSCAYCCILVNQLDPVELIGEIRAASTAPRDETIVII